MNVFYAKVDLANDPEPEMIESVSWCWFEHFENACAWVRDFTPNDGDVGTVKEVELPDGSVMMISLLNGTDPSGEVVKSFTAFAGLWTSESSATFEGLFITTGPETFLCSDCMPEELDAETAEFWEEGSGGWLGPIACACCKRAIPIEVTET